MSTLHPKYGYEGERPENKPTLEVETSVEIINGKLYGNIDGKGYKLIQAANHLHNIWIISDNGDLFAVHTANAPYKHSYFLKRNGYGLPVAAGGEFKVKDGKIHYLNNCSGHYAPNEDQLLLAAHYLYKKNVLTDDIVIKPCKSLTQYGLSDINAMNMDSILTHYPELE